MKTVFITGSNRGLGRGFVDYFSTQDFTVFAGVRNLQDFDPQLKKNPKVIPILIEVSDDKSIKDAVQSVLVVANKIDFLINNAGANKDSVTGGHKELVCNLTSLDRQTLQKIFDINTISPMMVLKNFLPLLSCDPSYVINISSGRASYHDENENTNGNYGYRASKTALNMLTFCSVFDLPKNVRTFTVHPGSVKTDMNPAGKSLPFDQARMIVDITNNWNEAFNGRFLRFDGTPYPL